MSLGVGRRLLQRLVRLGATLLGVTLLTFFLLHLAPGEPTALFDDGLGGAAPQAIRESWKQLRGLDAPLPVQYGQWLLAVLRLDFGLSFTDEQPVRALLATALPRTLLVMLPALVVIYVVAVPLGVFLAVRQGGRAERWLSATLLAGYAVPSFWLALVLIVVFASGGALSWFPLRGLTSPGSEAAGLTARALDLAWHLVLPVFCLSYAPICRTARLQRVAMREVLAQDYILAARARGLSEARVLWRHALPNALLPTAALLALDLPWLIGGSVVIERIFTIRGMGLLTFEAILQRNYPVLMGVTVTAALATILGMLVGDLLLGALDPRTGLLRRRP